MALKPLVILLVTAITILSNVSQTYSQTTTPPISRPSSPPMTPPMSTPMSPSAIPGVPGSSVCGTGGSPGNWPWLASLTRNGNYVCGGALINNQWVLTTSQCIMSLGSSDNVNITVGTSVSGSYYNATYTQERNFTICPMEAYFTNGICLILLQTPVPFSPEVQPVCLAAQDSSFYTGVNSWIAGWNLQPSGQLDYYDMYMTVVGENECSCRRGSPRPSKTICAAPYFSGSNLQSQGLPLMIHNGPEVVLAGILTEGCTGTEPCVFTDVSKYQAFIEEVMKSNNQSLPGVVSYTSWGVNTDLFFDCSATTTPPILPYTGPCEGLFCSGHRMAPSFGQLMTLCGLSLLLYVMG